MAVVRWSLAAEHDLQLIEDFVAGDSPLRAVAFVDRLVQSVGVLAVAPHLGRMVPELQREDLRELIFRGYRLVYLDRESEVTILRVVHGARDLRSLAQREPWELS